ncbi:FecCD family ABC transporter permease [Sneathiella sp. P13V-1]|uniref:FecCD family ABC transporter permease n=1 Tax=Sneathiella sp. P13V-1 TaxID=2697366 RepID=UPI002239316A|nr:iron ABC transporter permease [Sneathiella sp. P13V-1]
MAAIFLFSLSAGAIPVSVVSLIGNELSDVQKMVLSEIRLPRILLACLVGTALGISGAAMQGVFRNPLADPSLIGISGGASLSVALMIVIVGPLPGLLGMYGLGLAAFSGGLATSLLILHLARIGGAFSVMHMLLAGIAFNALTMSGTGFLMFLSDDQEMRALTFWTMGSLGGALWPSVIFLATLLIPTLFLLLRSASDLNVFMLGEENASYVGVDTKRLKRNVIVMSALSVGAAVAVSGLIGFIGLVVPHLVRLTISSDHKYLFPLSALMGAGLLLLADTIARIIVLPSEMPVGILTSLIGGPFFLWLLMKQLRIKF